MELCEAFNITVKTTGAEAPWSNGLIERHNLIIANMLDRVLEEHPQLDFDVALSWCVHAKNSLSNCHGFSPYQLSMGRNPVLQHLSEDKLPALTMSPSGEVLRQNLNAIHAARVAFMESERSTKLRRALAAQTRTYSNTVFLNGDKVFFQRKDSKRWRGPATVLGKDA